MEQYVSFTAYAFLNSSLSKVLENSQNFFLWTKYIIVLLIFYQIGCMKGMAISAVKCKFRLWC